MFQIFNSIGKITKSDKRSANVEFLNSLGPSQAGKTKHKNTNDARIAQ